jgi:hypothetical protein
MQDTTIRVIGMTVIELLSKNDRDENIAVDWHKE